MKIASILKLLVASSVPFISGHASAMFLVPPGDVTITDITYNGTGCPIGTVAENISADKQAFTLTFSEYVAEAGPGISLSQGRKNCQLTIVLEVPNGWQYSLASFDYRGFFYLDEAMQATHTTSYYFQGSGYTGSFSTTVAQAFDDNFTYTDLIPIESLVWSSCSEDRALNVNSAIKVLNTDRTNYPNSAALMTNDSIDGQITHKFGISWRRCD